MQKIRLSAVIGLVVLLGTFVPGTPLMAQESFTTGPISWDEFVKAVNLSDKTKINFSCTSLVRVMNASYDIGEMSCGRFAKEHMSKLSEADCPKEAIYVASVENGQVIDAPEARSFLGQHCMFEGARPEFVITGVPIILPASSRTPFRSRSVVSTKNVSVDKEAPQTPPTKVLTKTNTDTVRFYSRDTLRLTEIKHDTVTKAVTPKGKPCWSKLLSKCWGLTALGVGAGVGTGLLVCNNNPAYKVCGGQDSTYIYNENTHVISVGRVVKKGPNRSKTTDWEIGLNLPLAVLGKLKR